MPALKALGKFPGVLAYRNPESGLETEALGDKLRSPLVLGATVDPFGEATKVTSKLGFGAVVVGPVPEQVPLNEARDIKTPNRETRLWVEISEPNLMTELPQADGFLVEAGYIDSLEKTTRPTWIKCDFEECSTVAPLCLERGHGLYLEDLDLEKLSSLKAAYPDLTILSNNGSLSPADILALKRAGADLVVLDRGLLETGPGLPGRANDALLAELNDEVETDNVPVERMAWFWGAVLGLSMLVGAALAAWISVTDVVLPYDEEFCGLTAAQIRDFNPRIISFMTHDRFTLACTMVSLGLLYTMLSWKELKRGSQWAQRTISISALGGFFTFFAFLGFGYFDPHALVAKNVVSS